MQLRYRLDDEHSVLASGVITVERPASGPGFVPIVAAIGQALAEATAQLADVVLRTVSLHPAVTMSPAAGACMTAGIVGTR